MVVRGEAVDERRRGSRASSGARYGAASRHRRIVRPRASERASPRRSPARLDDPQERPPLLDPLLITRSPLGAAGCGTMEPSAVAARGEPMTDERAQASADAQPTAEARAFVEALFARHHGEIYAYLVRMVRDADLAADLTQDAFVKAYRAYDVLGRPDNPRAWLYQIAHRVAIDELRRRKIVRFVPFVGQTRATAPSPEGLAMDARLSGELARALARIPERQRAALLLAEVHDLTGLELAAVLGVSHIAVRALLTRARESLRQALAAEQAATAEREASAERSRDLAPGSPEGPRR